MFLLGVCDYEDDREEWLRWWQAQAAAESLKEELPDDMPKIIPSPLETPEPAHRRRLALRH